jgi:ferric-dicitrate binding protein FerR (iron transport regulator)
MTRLWQELARAQDAALAAEEVGPEVNQGVGHAGRLRRTATFEPSHGRERLRTHRRPGRLPFALGAATVAAGLIFVVLARKPPSRGEVSEPPRGSDAIPTLVADAENDLPLRFSDGSTVTFRAGSSGQLQRLTNVGAEMILARGALEAHVIHAAATNWIVHAGPYRVRVTGTRFGLSWRSDRLELSLYEGSVLVDGALLGSGVPVRAGQRLTVAAEVVRLEPLGAGAPAATAEMDAEPALAPRPGGEPKALRSPLSASRGSRSESSLASTAMLDEEWMTLADRGSYREALAVAKRIGWQNLCRRLDAHRLLTLADVARYSDARGRAQRAFAALVKRFPDDRLAGDAAFSLGRLAFEGGRPTEAARWFKRYVSDWPNGPLAEQAAGRLLESAIRMQDAEATRSAARAYLARAPKGAQAGLAHGVLAEPSDGPR